MQALTIIAIIFQYTLLTFISCCAIYWIMRAFAAHLECKELDVALKREELARRAAERLGE